MPSKNHSIGQQQQESKVKVQIPDWLVGLFNMAARFGGTAEAKFKQDLVEGNKTREELERFISEEEYAMSEAMRCAEEEEARMCASAGLEPDVYDAFYCD